jgi:hypothetical protein
MAVHLRSGAVHAVYLPYVAAGPGLATNNVLILMASPTGFEPVLPP